VEQDALLSSGTANSFAIGGYGSLSAGSTTVNFGGIFNWHDIDVERTFSAAGLSQDLSAIYSGRSYQGFAEASYRFEVNEHLALSPFAGVSHILMKVDGFTETGGSAALTASATTQNATYTTVGLRGDIQAG
jgi:outer membrane autotransporter protein